MALSRLVSHLLAVRRGVALQRRLARVQVKLLATCVRVAFADCACDEAACCAETSCAEAELPRIRQQFSQVAAQVGRAPLPGCVPRGALNERPRTPRWDVRRACQWHVRSRGVLRPARRQLRTPLGGVSFRYAQARNTTLEIPTCVARGFLCRSYSDRARRAGGPRLGSTDMCTAGGGHSDSIPESVRIGNVHVCRT